MKPLIWMTVLTLCLAVPRPAQARGQGGHLKKILEDLNLTEEQKTKIKALREKHSTTAKASRESLKGARKEMEEAVKSDASKGDLVKKFEALQTLRNKMGKTRFEMILEVREVLTPEQRQKFRAAFQDRMGKRNKGGDKGEAKEEKEEE